MTKKKVVHFKLLMMEPGSDKFSLFKDWYSCYIADYLNLIMYRYKKDNL